VNHLLFIYKSFWFIDIFIGYCNVLAATELATETFLGEIPL